jgi:hypothetical protein
MCEFYTSKLTKHNNKRYCILCIMSLIPSTLNTNKLVACYSIKAQSMINRDTREFILKHNRIPKPEEIDKNCRPVLVNPTVLFQVISKMNKDDSMCFLNIKLFFTDELNIKDIKVFRITDKIPSKNSTWITTLTYIPMLKHQKLIYDKYYTTFVETTKTNIQSLFI